MHKKPDTLYDNMNCGQHIVKGIDPLADTMKLFNPMAGIKRKKPTAAQIKKQINPDAPYNRYPMNVYFTGKMVSKKAAAALEANEEFVKLRDSYNFYNTKELPVKTHRRAKLQQELEEVKDELKKIHVHAPSSHNFNSSCNNVIGYVSDEILAQSVEYRQNIIDGLVDDGNTISANSTHNRIARLKLNIKKIIDDAQRHNEYYRQFDDIIQRKLEIEEALLIKSQPKPKPKPVVPYHTQMKYDLMQIVKDTMAKYP